MSDPIDTGGAAFPFAAEYGHPAACGGMSLRDWFAGQALATMDYDSDADAKLAWRAYSLADAMLAERRAHQTREQS